MTRLFAMAAAVLMVTSARVEPPLTIHRSELPRLYAIIYGVGRFSPSARAVPDSITWTVKPDDAVAPWIRTLHAIPKVGGPNTAAWRCGPGLEVSGHNLVLSALCPYPELKGRGRVLLAWQARADTLELLAADYRPEEGFELREYCLLDSTTVVLVAKGCRRYYFISYDIVGRSFRYLMTRTYSECIEGSRRRPIQSRPEDTVRYEWQCNTEGAIVTLVHERFHWAESSEDLSASIPVRIVDGLDTTRVDLGELARAKR